MKLFSRLPLKGYLFENDEEYFYFRDIFVKLKIVDSLKENTSFLMVLPLKSAERADVIAYKLYKRSDLFWTLYLVNDVVDPSEWIMDSYTLDRYVKEKYDNPYAVHHYEKDGKIADLRANQIMVNKKPFKTIDSNLDPHFLDSTTYFPISNFQYEDMINESKRIIKAIRKEYMTPFLIDVENKLREANV